MLILSNTYIFNRTDNDKDSKGSTYDVYDEQFLEEGPALRGAVLKASRRNCMGD